MLLNDTRSTSIPSIACGYQVDCTKYNSNVPGINTSNITDIPSVYYISYYMIHLATVQISP